MMVGSRIPKLAIHPDRVLDRHGNIQSFSSRWVALARERGWAVAEVNAWSSRFAEELRDYDIFLWRVKPDYQQTTLMKRIALLNQVNNDTIIYPSWQTLICTSKVDQAYLFASNSIPTPQTFVFLEKDEALRFAENAKYPFVIKLDSGYGGANVAKVTDRRTARRIIDLLWSENVHSLPSNAGDIKSTSFIYAFIKYRLKPALKLAVGAPLENIFWGGRLHHGYLYAQEFVSGNDFDTRVCVIGSRAFVFRRSNRPGDFRASGSGFTDFLPELHDEAVVKLAFHVADVMGTQSNAMDFIYKEGKPLLLECNLSFASWAIRDCPGHWIFDRNTQQLSWSQGTKSAEDAIFEVILEEFSRRQSEV